MPSPAPSTQFLQTLKPNHTLILDASPLLLNTPPLSTLLSKSTQLFTTPSVLAEIRDENARLRIETQYLPFLTLRTPKPESVKFVRDFARKTGDLVVLSETDVEILALAYELECERNGGDWRLRRVPGQKKVNGRKPEVIENKDQPLEEQNDADNVSKGEPDPEEDAGADNVFVETQPGESGAEVPPQNHDTDLTAQVTSLSIQEHGDDTSASGAISPEEVDISESDSDGWITPSNIQTHKASEERTSKATADSVKTLQVATITGDFAMQNVILQMNLNLLSSTTCQRITHIKQTILRCHGCFATTKDMLKQFCPRCGNPTLTRVTCTTSENGEVKLHLKANMQWNNRGNVYSIPKPTAGAANQKWQGPKHGGGRGGWGNKLVLAEDQKEYTRSVSDARRSRPRDIMDEDYLPAMLTGTRDRGPGRLRVGAGRTVNSRKGR